MFSIEPHGFTMIQWPCIPPEGHFSWNMGL